MKCSRSVVRGIINIYNWSRSVAIFVLYAANKS